VVRSTDVERNLEFDARIPGLGGQTGAMIRAVAPGMARDSSPSPAPSEACTRGLGFSATRMAKPRSSSPGAATPSACCALPTNCLMLTMYRPVSAPVTPNRLLRPLKRSMAALFRLQRSHADPEPRRARPGPASLRRRKAARDSCRAAVWWLSACHGLPSHLPSPQSPCCRKTNCSEWRRRGLY